SFENRLVINIQRRRVERELSQESVAFGANLSRFTYQQLEKGESRPGTPANPSLSNIMAISEVLNVDLGELLPQPWPDLRAK
ncbi:MAG: helix-turn-helix transcriptional regulator, partial [Bifidobacterium sp.]